MIEIIEVTVTVVETTIDHPAIMRAAAVEEIEIETETETVEIIIENATTTIKRSQKKRSTHTSNARRKTRKRKTMECSGMVSSGSRKHKGNMISNNLILFCRKTRKASKRRRRD
jgi:hypothetical protein